jgi:hypothetical protein
LDGLPVEQCVDTEDEAHEQCGQSASTPDEEGNQRECRQSNLSLDVVELEETSPRAVGNQGRRYFVAVGAADVTKASAHDEFCPATRTGLRYVRRCLDDRHDRRPPKLTISVLNNIAHCWNSPFRDRGKLIANRLV